MDRRKACGMKIVWDTVGKQINICLACVHKKKLYKWYLSRSGRTDLHNWRFCFTNQAYLAN